jgi:cytochrome c peroxidase
MKKKITLLLSLITLAVIFFSFNKSEDSTVYKSVYYNRLNDFKVQQLVLVRSIEQSTMTASGIENIKEQIRQSRIKMKGLDFWFRYLEPVSYKKINGPLPVEWETEVF